MAETLQISLVLEVAIRTVRSLKVPRNATFQFLMPSVDYLDGLPGFCAQRVLRDPTVWLGVFAGGFLTVFLMLYRIRGSILVGIFLVAIISWPRNTAVTYFPHTDSGDDLFAFFKQVVAFRPLRKVGLAIDVSFRVFTILPLDAESVR